MGFSDNFYKKVEQKTNVNKDTILSLAKKLQGDNLKNEGVLRDLIQEIGTITGKTVPKSQEDKIVNAIVTDKVPKNIDKMIEEKVSILNSKPIYKEYLRRMNEFNDILAESSNTIEKYINDKV